MRTPWISMLLATVLLFVSQLTTAVRGADSDYETIVAQIRGGHTGIDYAQLRNAYTETSKYNPYGRATGRLSDAMLNAFSNGDCAQALASSDEIFEMNFTDIEAHVVAGMCHRKNGDAARSEQERSIASGLLGSILGSGDGKTAETAYIVMSTDEEYKCLDALGLRVLGRGLVRQGNSAFDRFEVKAAGTAGRIVLYFNVDRPMGTLLKAAGQKR